MPSLNPGSYNDFWRVVRNAAKFSKGASATAPCVDHCSCDVDIANAFGDKLHSLLNSDNSSQPLLANNESSLSSSELASISVSPLTVSEALAHLKSNKSDGTLLMSNHFIY